MGLSLNLSFVVKRGGSVFSQFSLTSHFVKLTRNGLLIKVQSQNTSAGKSVLGKLWAPFVLFQAAWPRQESESRRCFICLLTVSPFSYANDGTAHVLLLSAKWIHSVSLSEYGRCRCHLT